MPATLPTDTTVQVTLRRLSALVRRAARVEVTVRLCDSSDSSAAACIRLTRAAALRMVADQRRRRGDDSFADVTILFGALLIG